MKTRLAIAAFFITTLAHAQDATPPSIYRELLEHMKLVAQQGNSAPEFERKEIADHLTAMGYYWVAGTVLNVIQDGAAILVNCPREPIPGPPISLIGGTEIDLPPRTTPAEIKGYVILLLLPPNLVNYADHDDVSYIVRPTGQVYHYTSATGAESTVRVFDLDTQAQTQDPPSQ
jgi:hypothetical protein